MIDTQKVWTFVNERLREGVSVILLVVVETEGLTPAKRGFKMAVAHDGGSEGTVGGGRAEYMLIEKAKEMLRRGITTPAMERQVLRDEMICGGEQTVLLQPCLESDGLIIDRICNAVENLEEGVIGLSPQGIHWIPGDSAVGDQGWSYHERMRWQHRVYIVGGGHVGLALSGVLSKLDFFITVFDDRPHVDTMTSNVYAHEKVVIPFGDVHQRIPQGRESYVAIMTPSHRADELVLRNLLDSDYRYLGLMASEMKIRETFARLLVDGFEPEQLEKVRTPIGIPINSHTPEEIAVSIAAEMIQVKNA